MKKDDIIKYIDTAISAGQLSEKESGRIRKNEPISLVKELGMGRLCILREKHMRKLLQLLPTSKIPQEKLAELKDAAYKTSQMTGRYSLASAMAYHLVGEIRFKAHDNYPCTAASFQIAARNRRHRKFLVREATKSGGSRNRKKMIALALAFAELEMMH